MWKCIIRWLECLCEFVWYVACVCHIVKCEHNQYRRYCHMTTLPFPTTRKGPCWVFFIMSWTWCTKSFQSLSVRTCFYLKIAETIVSTPHERSAHQPILGRVGYWFTSIWRVCRYGAYRIRTGNVTLPTLSDPISLKPQVVDREGSIFGCNLNLSNLSLGLVSVCRPSHSFTIRSAHIIYVSVVAVPSASQAWLTTFNMSFRSIIATCRSKSTWRIGESNP